MPLDDLLLANRAFAEGFDRGHLAAPPARALAVLTCMDARIQPEAFLGLGPGDANVIRNAGGRASDDAIRSLIVSTRLLGAREVLVVQHTDCGMLAVTNEELHATIREETGADPSGIDFLPLADLETSVQQDVDRVRRSPFLDPSLAVWGLVYDVRTGRLTLVAGRSG